MQAPNARTDPQQKIQRITDTWPSDDRSPFHGIRPQRPLAKLHIRRLSQQVRIPLLARNSQNGHLILVYVKKKLLLVVT